jgi:hypothetical protein
MKIEIIFDATAKSLAAMQETDIETAKRQLKSLGRQKIITLHRKAFCAITKQETFATFTHIGDYLKRDHASVMYHCRTSPWTLRSDTDYLYIYNNVKGWLKRAVENNLKEYEDKTGALEFLNKASLRYGRRNRETYRSYAMRFITEHIDDVINIIQKTPK